MTRGGGQREKGHIGTHCPCAPYLHAANQASDSLTLVSKKRNRLLYNPNIAKWFPFAVRFGRASPKVGRAFPSGRGARRRSADISLKYGRITHTLTSTAHRELLVRGLCSAKLAEMFLIPLDVSLSQKTFRTLVFLCNAVGAMLV